MLPKDVDSHVWRKDDRKYPLALRTPVVLFYARPPVFKPPAFTDDSSQRNNLFLWEVVINGSN